MYFPVQKNLRRSRRTLDRFYGLEHRANVREGAFYDAENLRPDAYPLLRTRKVRGRLTDPLTGEEPVIETDTPVTAAAEVSVGLCLCSETGVYLNGERLTDCDFDRRPGERRILSFGRNIFIVPDGKYIMIGGDGTPKTRHAAFCIKDAAVGVRYGFAPGITDDYMYHTAGDTAPEETHSGLIWLNTGGDQPVLSYCGDYGWERAAKVYLILEGAGIGARAKAGDAVLLSLDGGEAQNYTAAFTEADRLWLAGKYRPLADNTAVVTLEKRIPLLDFAVEHNNRIWGCRYGENMDGEFVNEIYASAQGDPTVWDRFDGVSTDSYCVSLGCAGPFTGACVLDGALLFFKENSIIRVTGSVPAEFTVTVLPARGVAAGASRSCVVHNERAYYYGAGGVMVYDGVLPAVISDALADYRLTEVFAAGCDGTYYLSAAVDGGGRKLFVYDSRTGLWQKEDDDRNTRFFVTVGGRLFSLCSPGDAPNRTVLVPVDGRGPLSQAAAAAIGATGVTLSEEEPFCWYAETGPLDVGNNAKYLRRLIFRLKLEEEGAFSAFLLPDVPAGDGEEIRLCRVCRQKAGVFSVPVNTPRCHSFRLRLAGRGGCTLYSVTAVSEPVGEVTGLGA